jgi:cysteine desulfurase
MIGRTYLYWNATAPLRPEARAGVIAALDDLGNPSSVHREGRTVRRLVEQARERVAALVGAEPRNVVFTSGATEANMLALTSAFESAKDKPRRCERLVVSAIEHASVRSGGRFPAAQVGEFGATADGVVDLSGLERRLTELKWQGAPSPLVSVMLPTTRPGGAADRKRPWCMRSAGCCMWTRFRSPDVSVRYQQDGCDLIVSAHKLGGPWASVRWSGALPRRTSSSPHQGRRAGARRPRRHRKRPGIAGLGRGGGQPWSDGVRCRAHAGTPGEVEARLTGWAMPAQANLDALSNQDAVSGLKAEIALINLDLGGFAVSSGSACSSGKVTASHVLTAMGVAPELVAGAIRVSIGPTTTENEIDSFLEAWTKVVAGLSRDKGGLAA